MFPRFSRFEFVEGPYTGASPAICCDGHVPGATLELSHWPGNRTPMEFKADTSTEVALKFVQSQASLTLAGALIVNNHFDVDGVLATWVLLEPEHAATCSDLLVAAAEVGDFDEWPGEDRGLWLEAAIRALAASAADDAEAYRIILPQLPELAQAVDTRRDLWGADWDRLQQAVAAVEAGRLSLHPGPIALARHAPGEPEVPGPLLARHFLPGARRYLLAFDGGDGTVSYRYERPRYAWAETVVRPAIPSPDAAKLAQDLGPDWTAADVPGMTGLVQTRRPIAESPDRLLARLAGLDP